MEKKNVFIMNYASHYRLNIYKKIGEELNADFYFGNLPKTSIKKINYEELPYFKGEFKTVKIGHFFYYIGCLKLLLKPYRRYVLTGDPFVLSNWFFLILGKLLGKKIFLWTHGWYGREGKIKKIIKKIFLNLSEKIILYGDYAKGLMIEEGFDENKLFPIYNSLDYDSQISIRKTLSKTNLYVDYFKNNKPVIIYIGRVQKSKKIELILEAMKNLDNQGIELNLVVVGGVDSDYDIHQFINNKGLENRVWMYGPSYDEHINGELIYNADICVSPGNVGLTAIHSLMYGTPVLTHNNFSNQGPEFEVIQDGITGAFFNENDVINLQNKIIFLLENKIEKKMCFSKIDEKWNPKNQIKLLKKILE